MTCARSHAPGRGAHGAPSLEHDLSRQRVSSTAPRCSCLPGTHWSPGAGPGPGRVTWGSAEHCSSDTSSEGLARGRGGWIPAREGTRGRLHPAQPSTQLPSLPEHLRRECDPPPPRGEQRGVRRPVRPPQHHHQLPRRAPPQLQQLRHRGPHPAAGARARGGRGHPPAAAAVCHELEGCSSLP